MPELWRSDDTETQKLTDKRAEDLIIHLKKIKYTDSPWLTFFNVQIDLNLDEFTAIGIIIYLWLQDKIHVKRGDMGELLVMAGYEPSVVTTTEAE